VLSHHNVVPPHIFVTEELMPHTLRWVGWVTCGWQGTTSGDWPKNNSSNGPQQQRPQLARLLDLPTLFFFLVHHIVTALSPCPVPLTNPVLSAISIGVSDRCL
jgi:hypothetical protein